MKNTAAKILENSTRHLVALLFTLVMTMAFLTVPLMISADAQSPIVNFVSAGGPDLQDPDIPGSGPGYDKNYSLVAFLYADGTARGTLIDRYAGQGLGLRAVIDCVHVVGNTAWVSGVVTQGQSVDAEGNPFDITGYYVRTRVQDNGVNNDPNNPDKIAFTIIRASAPWVCSDMRGFFMDMPRGQVTIR